MSYPCEGYLCGGGYPLRRGLSSAEGAILCGGGYPLRRGRDARVCVPYGIGAFQNPNIGEKANKPIYPDSVMICIVGAESTGSCVLSTKTIRIELCR